MKKLIIVLMVGFVLIPLITSAAPKVAKVIYWSLTKTAQVSEQTTMHRIEDGNNVCYVVEGKNTAISCVGPTPVFPTNINTRTYTRPCELTNNCQDAG